MIVYAVMTPGDHAGLQATLDTKFINDYLKVGTGQYLVAAKTTVVEVSNTLGITDGSNGSGIIVAVGAYYGRADQNIWQWLKIKTSAL